MRFLKLIIPFLFLFPCIMAQVNYSPAFFGPNANPVLESGNAIIPDKTVLKVSGNYFFGFDDNTQNLHVAFEVPLLPSFVSINVWGNFLERYRVTPEVYRERGMNTNNLRGFIYGGDIYVQMRMLLLKEKTYIPAVILNNILKTASSNKIGFEGRRYFDTPGYCFDLELGKSLKTSCKGLNKIRLVGNIGFYCWETSGSRQNDAIMYGGKIILSNPFFDFENTLSGYKGWICNGDNPLIYTVSLHFRKQKRINYFMTYKYGIKDYPYHSLNAGILVPIDKLTPRYIK